MQAFFGAGFTTFCFNLWGPTYYQEVLGCTPTVAGAYLAWQTPVAFVGDWLVVGAEELLPAGRLLVPLVAVKAPPVRPMTRVLIGPSPNHPPPQGWRGIY